MTATVTGLGPGFNTVTHSSTAASGSPAANAQRDSARVAPRVMARPVRVEGGRASTVRSATTPTPFVARTTMAWPTLGGTRGSSLTVKVTRETRAR